MGRFGVCMDVMIDLETLNVSPNAAIISIGAVKFDIDGTRLEDQMFYASISVDSNTRANRSIDESTLMWWMQQSPEAQKVFTEPKCDLQDALENFTDWFNMAPYGECVWSNGASFDIPMMIDAYAQLGQKTPWKFWDERCMRTLKNLPGMKAVKVAKNPNAHNALSDAIYQAELTQAMWKKLNGHIPHPMIKAKEVT